MADQLATVSKLRLLNRVGRLRPGDMSNVEAAMRVQLAVYDAIDAAVFHERFFP